MLSVLEDVNLDKIAACADKALERYVEPAVAIVNESLVLDSVAKISKQFKKLELEIVFYVQENRGLVYVEIAQGQNLETNRKIANNLNVMLLSSTI